MGKSRTRKSHNVSWGSPPIDRHEEVAWFDTDGTSAPSVYSGNIESVTRETDASSTNVFYRLTFKFPVLRSGSNARSVYQERADITNAHDTQYGASVSDRSGIPSGGAVPTIYQADIIVLDHEQTTLAPTWVNNVPAGHRVYYSVVMDFAAPKD